MGGGGPAPADEPVEQLDEEGNVVGLVTRAEMRARRLRHRCTYVVVVDDRDRVIVHRRAPWKDVYPGYWDVAFGGVCGVGADGVGEPWVAAARRELAEEAGLTNVALWPLGAVRYEGDDGSILGQVYVTRSRDPITCPDGEVSEVARVPLAELADWVGAHRVCTDSATVVVPLVLGAMALGANAVEPAGGGGADQPAGDADWLAAISAIAVDSRTTAEAKSAGSPEE